MPPPLSDQAQNWPDYLELSLVSTVHFAACQSLGKIIYSQQKFVL